MAKALRLADALTHPTYPDWVVHIPAPWHPPAQEVREAAAELRRLAAVEAQRDALKQTLHDELAGNLRLRDLGGARPNEPMLTFLERIIAERDALLEALKEMLEYSGLIEERCDTVTTNKARAAIEAVEEAK